MRQAGMEISVPKTNAQHIRKIPRVSGTTEADITNLPEEKKFKFHCDACGMSYPTKHGLSVHKGRWCKGRRNARRPSRTGTLADRMVKSTKVDKFQETLKKVKMGEHELKTVHSFVYLGAEIAGNGDQEVTVKHRCNIAWGRFGEYRKTLTSTKLPLNMKIRLFETLVVSTMIYSSSAWSLTSNIKRKINGISSKMLQISKKAIHEEAKNSTPDVTEIILKRRWSYLSHILRMNKNQAVRRYLLELSPNEAPYLPGSLLADTWCGTVNEMTIAAANHEQWKATWRKR